MRASEQKRLVQVWAFLCIVTLVSWLIGRDRGIAYQVNTTVTVSVLTIAAVKALLVFRYFMEVRFGPAWLKRTMYGWAVGLPALLAMEYWVSR